MREEETTELGMKLNRSYPGKKWTDHDGSYIKRVQEVRTS